MEKNKSVDNKVGILKEDEEVKNRQAGCQWQNSTTENSQEAMLNKTLRFAIINQTKKDYNCPSNSWKDFHQYFFWLSFAPIRLLFSFISLSWLLTNDKFDY